MKRGLKTFVTLSVVVALVAFTSNSCRRKKDTIAEITVRDAGNQLVSGASVRLYGQPSDPSTGTSTEVIVDKTTTTNSSGVAQFNFNDVYQLGQAGVAVLNIKATYGAASGEGIIKIEEETTSSETVFVQ